MKVLIIGSGGREHAIGWKLVQSPNLSKLYFAPGNGGTLQIGENIELPVMDFQGICDFINSTDISLVVVGPEAPLVEGLVDYLEGKIPDSCIIIGPKKEGAVLEGSKEWSKEFMVRHNIPTGNARTFSKETLEEGLAFIEKQNTPIVLKADGLAAGKGVLILDSIDAAKTEMKAMLSGKFGAASDRVLVEEFLDGIEFSVFALTDGKSYKILPVAKDYKRIGEGDTGLNTGGMGAVSPVPFVDSEMMKKVEERIIVPTIEGLQKENIEYIGFIFFGLIVVKGEPYVIEYNCRMGDPETEVVVPRIKNDLLTLLSSVGSDQFKKIQVDFSEQSAATIMVVSGGYPEAYEKGKTISIGDTPGSIVFHAGTKLENDILRTAGGRVIAVTSLASDFQKALSISQHNIERVSFEKMNYRSDIGFDL